MPHVLNFEVFQEDGVLKIGIDLIALNCEIDRQLLPHHLKLEEVRFYNDHEDYVYQKTLIHSLNQSHQPSCQIAFNNVSEKHSNSGTITCQNKTLLYCGITRLSSTYTLSVVPHVAINWLVCVSNYINCISNLIHAILYNERETMDDDIGPFLTLSKKYEILEPKNIKGYSICVLLQELSEFNDLPEYSATVNAIRALSKYYISNRKSKNPLPLISCLQTANKFKIFWPYVKEQMGYVFSLEYHQTYEYSVVIQFVKNYLHNHGAAECEYLIKNIELLAKENLYKKCIKERAHDGGTYHWAYTEWYLIKNAEFIFNSAEQSVSIVNINKNAGYLSHYAIGKSNHAIYENEMKFLFNILDLQISSDCNLRKEIVFMPESSKKLIEQGLLFSVNNIKDKLYLTNRLNLFSRARYNGPNTEIGVTSLPSEIQEKIVRYSL